MRKLMIAAILLILASPAIADDAVVYEPDPNTEIIQSSDSTVTILRDGDGNVLEVQVDD